MGAVFALFAGFYYWTPKIVGRNINDFLGKIHFWTFFMGVNLTFFPQHFLGLAGIYLIISDYVATTACSNSCLPCLKQAWSLFLKGCSFMQLGCLMQASLLFLVASRSCTLAFDQPRAKVKARQAVVVICTTACIKQATVGMVMIMKINSLINNEILLSLIAIKPYGPHIFPVYLTQPVRFYKPNLDRNLIAVENRNRTVIYQWINLINGKLYVGSGWNGSRRLLSYWTPSVLKRNLPIYNSLSYYTHNNFILAILEDLGTTGSVSKEFMLSREQLYLDLLFTKLYPSLNNSPSAGPTLGFKHKPEFGLNRSGVLNPMMGRKLSPEFIEMQNLCSWSLPWQWLIKGKRRNKNGVNNPQFGVIKSSYTIAKITKLVYVYNSVDLSYIGSYSTVQCSKEFNMGKDTLSKYLLNGIPFKGKIFSRVLLHNS
jgi:group I intron endonuclease